MIPTDAASRARFSVSRSESWLNFDGRSTLHAVHGRCADLEGFIEAAWGAEGTLATSPEPTMHVGFLVEQLHSGYALQDHEIWKRIDSKRFPRITAALHEIRPAQETARYTAVGDITLAGRTRRYEGVLTVLRAGDAVTVDGGLQLDLRDFGIKPPSLLLMKVDPAVNVQLHLIARSA